MQHVTVSFSFTSDFFIMLVIIVRALVILLVLYGMEILGVTCGALIVCIELVIVMSYILFLVFLIYSTTAPQICF